MFAIYITHPQVRIDPAIDVPRWGLSETGTQRAGLAASKLWARTIRRIVSSDETKAVETANILAGATGISVEIAKCMHENDRSATGFLPPAEFEAAADRFFGHPEESFRGWERAIDAQVRIVGAVELVLASHDLNQPIAFVGHGAVGTLLKCHLRGEAISRAGDQRGGGGNLFAFDLANRAVSCDWTPIEDWQGWGLNHDHRNRA